MLHGPLQSIFAGATRRHVEKSARSTARFVSSRARATPAQHWRTLAQKPANHLFQFLDPKWVLIQARDETKLTPARSKKSLSPPDADLLQRFQTIPHDCRAHNQQHLDPTRCQLRQLMVRIGLQPRSAPKA